MIFIRIDILFLIYACKILSTTFSWHFKLFINFLQSQITTRITSQYIPQKNSLYKHKHIHNQFI